MNRSQAIRLTKKALAAISPYDVQTMKVSIPTREKLDSGELQTLRSAILSALSKYKPTGKEKDVIEKVILEDV